jgi:carboxypeptidase Taq
MSDTRTLDAPSGPATPAAARLLELWAEYADVSSAAGLLGWDQEVFLPPRGQAGRGKVLATLAGIAHRALTSTELADAVAAAEEAAEPDSVDAAQAREARREMERARRVPEALEKAFAESRSAALVCWQQARKDKDFAAFLPTLERQVGLVRERADALRGEDGTRYDALLEEFEPGARVADLEPLFAHLRAELAPMVQSAADSGREVDESVAHGAFPADAQRGFVREVAAAIGFDFQAGRLDPAAHPFCSGFGAGDVRLTWRWYEDDFRPALFGVMHEAGHGLYEQGMPAAWHRTPLGRDAGLGIHESQSRLWENRVGRSRAFWDWVMPRFRAAYPGHAPDADALWKALHTCRPSPIRVEADEATYDLHILLRFAIERPLVEGGLEPADLPAAWAEQSAALLGFVPEDDAQGVLQDIHWAMGLFGYFPTYTLGNMYAAQLYEAADRELGIDALAAAGDFGPLLDWLRVHVHRHGRSRPAAELVEAASGAPPSPEPLLEHLRANVAAVYGV